MVLAIAGTLGILGLWKVSLISDEAVGYENQYDESLADLTRFGRESLQVGNTYLAALIDAMKVFNFFLSG